MTSQRTAAKPNNEAASLYPVSLGDLLRHELLYVLWAMMEITIIVPLILAIAPWARFWPPEVVALLLLLLMLVPFNLSRLASMFKVTVERQQLFMVFALIATLLVAWRTLLYEANSILDISWLGQFVDHINQGDNPLWSRDLLVFVMVVLVWWRGISLVGRRIDIGDIGLRFRFGILLEVFLVAGLAGSQLGWSVTPFILLFFFVSLMAIILTRVEQLERSHSGQSFPIGFRWLLLVVGAAALVTYTIGLISGFIGGDSVAEVIGWFAPLWLAMNFLITSSLITVTVLSTPLLTAFGWFLSWIIGIIGPTLQLRLQEFQFLTQQPLATPSPEELSETTETINLIPRQLLPLLIMLFVVLLVAWALGQLFRTMRQTAKLEAETMISRPGLGRLERPDGRRHLLDRLGLWRRWRTAASIRHIYQEMCHMAADHGYPRANSETPYEYRTTLAKAWPNNMVDINTITEAFVRVRYGEIPETQDEVNKIRSAWQKLEELPPEEIGHNPEGVDGQEKLDFS